MNRSEAWALVNEYTKNPRLINHMLAVETCMIAYAEKGGRDEATWGLIGLLHDFDYERWPEPPDHPLQGERILAELGVSETIRYSICSHASYMSDRYPRINMADKMLFAVDELSGLVVATALVRPSKSIFDVDVAAVKKKFKDKRFAAGVNRDEVIEGARVLGLDLDTHIAFVIEALKANADALGLRGTVEV